MAAPFWTIRIGQGRRGAAIRWSGLLVSASAKPLHTAVAQRYRMASVRHQGIHQEHLRVGLIGVEEHRDFRCPELLKHVGAQVPLSNQLAKVTVLGRGL